MESLEQHARVSSLPADARQHPRLPLVVEVHLQSENNFYAGITDNISEGGVFVATVNPPEIGTVVEFELHLPPDHGPFHLVGEVRWHRPVRAAIDGAPAGCGIRFTALSVETARAIAAFVQQRETILFDVD